MSETAKKPLNLWAAENHKNILELRYRVKRSLYSEESDFQQIDIVETEGFGKMLFNDSIVMLSERDEFVYHEMISHVPLFVHPGVERVLVIGGGDGGTVRELLRHASVTHCRLVEIDKLVVEGCRKHIPQTAAALDDPRVTVTIGDGVAFVAETDERYDLVIVDSTDPIGPATPLFGEQFYANVQRILTANGIAISQAESPYYEPDCQSSMLTILGGLFERVHLYNYVNLTYPGGLWSFTFASKGGLCPIGDFNAERVTATGLTFEYYSPAIHKAAFVLPEFQRRQLGESIRAFKQEPV
jgi:spermidine synthase